jgi:outer membrane receptor protein involved in Fe transport
MALLDQPAFSSPGAGPVGSASGSFGAGQTFANLYDLGSQRTLTLVNGNRFVSPASSSIFGAVAGSPVDLSQIAPALVDRIEVVSVGGAPIYGSDAIAGTVNVILKKNYQGFSVSGSQGISGKGDGHDFNASLLAGKNFADGRGNIAVSVFYDRQDGMTYADRSSQIGGTKPFTGTALPGNGYTHQLFYGGQHYNIFTNTGIPLFADDIPIYKGQPYAGITNAAGQALTFNNAGQLTPFINGQLTGSGLVQAGGSGFAIGDYDNFLNDSERLQGTLLAHYDITDHIRFNGEVWLGRNFATNVAAQPYYNTAQFNSAGQPNGNLILSTANPYLSAADRQTIINSLAANGSPTDTFYLTRANTDLSSGSYRTRTDLLRFVGGLTGDFTAGERKFGWDLTVNYGRSTSSTASRELVTRTSTMRSMPSPTPMARSPARRVIPARLSHDQQHLRAAQHLRPRQCQPGGDQLHHRQCLYPSGQFAAGCAGRCEGRPHPLPGGYLKGVAGYEYRRESAFFDPGAFFRGELQSDGSYLEYGGSVPITPVSGKFHTNEFFGELNAPVISPDNEVPFISSLDLNAAVRYVKHSLTGGFTSYTGGGTYAPVKG